LNGSFATKAESQPLCWLWQDWLLATDEAGCFGFYKNFSLTIGQFKELALKVKFKKNGAQIYIGKMGKRGYKLQNGRHLEFSRVSVTGLTSKFLNKKSILIILLFAVLLFNLAMAAASHPTLMGLQGKVQDSSGNDVASANLTVNISTSNSCTTDVFFSHNYPNNVSSGIFDLTLGSTYQLNLSYNEDYYLCIFVDGEQVGGPYRFRGGQGQIGSEDINKTDDYTFGSVNVTDSVNVTNNITVGDSIIPDTNNTGSIGSSLLHWASGFFNAIYEAGSLLSDLYCKLTGCTISGDLNVTGNVNVSGNLNVSGTLTAANFSTPYGQVVTVAKSGGDFTDIQAAIDSITDASASKPYVIKIYPGVYEIGTGEITLKAYVTLMGTDKERVKIRGNKPTTTLLHEGTIDMSDNSALHSLCVETYASTSIHNAVSIDRKNNVLISNCQLRSTASSGRALFLYGDTGKLDNVIIENSEIIQEGTGETGILIKVGGENVKFKNCIILADRRGIYLQNSYPTKTFFDDCFIRIAPDQAGCAVETSYNGGALFTNCVLLGRNSYTFWEGAGGRTKFINCHIETYEGTTQEAYYASGTGTTEFYNTVIKGAGYAIRTAKQGTGKPTPKLYGCLLKAGGNYEAIYVAEDTATIDLYDCTVLKSGSATSVIKIGSGAGLTLNTAGCNYNAPYSIPGVTFNRGFTDIEAYEALTIAADDTTPSVNASNLFKTSANTQATDITNFDDGKPGQIITVIGGSDTNASTLASGTYLKLSAAMTLGENDSITLVKVVTPWIETSRSTYVP